MIDDSLTLHRFFLITLKHRKDGNATLKIFLFSSMNIQNDSGNKKLKTL